MPAAAVSGPDLRVEARPAGAPAASSTIASRRARRVLESLTISSPRLAVEGQARGAATRPAGARARRKSKPLGLRRSSRNARAERPFPVNAGEVDRRGCTAARRLPRRATRRVRAERVLDRRGRAREGVAAARDAPQRDAAGREAAVGRQRDPVLAEPELLGERENPRPKGRQLGAKLERDVVALELHVAACTPRHRSKPPGGPHPDRRPSAAATSPIATGYSTPAPQQPAAAYRRASTSEAAAAGHTGTGVRASASCTASSAVTPAERCSGATISRCVSAATASALMSSGWT